MNLQFITCSGTNEHTDICRLAQMMQDFPLMEIGVQVSDLKCGAQSPRYDWIMQLHDYVSKHLQPVSAALHVNCGWVEKFGQGNVADELRTLLSLEDFRHQPFFRRVQLNFKVGREKTPDVEKLVNLMHIYGDHRFILSYNDSNKEIIDSVYEKGMMFDCLYDGSFGKGVVPDFRPEPVYAEIVQGYAGGISADNVANVLDEISEYTHPVGVYVDAQGKLEDDEGHLSLPKAYRYLKNATDWLENNNWI